MRNLRYAPRSGDRVEIPRFAALTRNDDLQKSGCDIKEDAILEELTGKLRQWIERNLGGERTDLIYATDGAWTCYIDRKGER